LKPRGNSFQKRHKAGFSGKLNFLKATHRIPDGIGEFLEGLLNACGSPFEHGSKLQNRKLNVLCDFGCLWFSGFVLEVFSANVFGTVKPNMSCLSCIDEEFCYARDC